MEFVKFLLPFFETVDEADYGPFPQPLSEMLVKPTLEYWCENENLDERPFVGTAPIIKAKTICSGLLN